MLRPLFLASLTLLAACGVSGASSVASTSAAVNTSDVTPDQPENFRVVTNEIYRGGHPDAGGLAYLQGLGVTTIVDLEIGDLIESTPWAIDDEIKGATALGINDIREPMSAFELALSSSFDTKIDNILTILADPSQKPVYVHCSHGQDRTGLVIGLERVFNEGWAPADAWNEMLADGFHVGFLGLDGYFFRKTGWNPIDGSPATADAGSDAPIAVDGGVDGDTANLDDGGADGGDAGGP